MKVAIVSVVAIECVFLISCAVPLLIKQNGVDGLANFVENGDLVLAVAMLVGIFLFVFRLK